MSTERLSFGFNSLIPETYKSKAEAFAKCLQHKLLSLGRIDSSSGSYGGGSRRLSSENQENQAYHGGNSKQALENNAKKPSSEGRTVGNFVEINRKLEKTDDSDEEFRSHSESENGVRTEKKEQKLVSMSSEDSTLDSWSSCQENLTDLEKFDSENEEVNSFAAQIKGSPKLRSFNIRTKRKEPRKRNSRKSHSSSTESIDSERMKQSQNRQIENLDPEFSSQCILLDGLVPHRILRESSSTSNLERHFSSREDDAGNSQRNTLKLEKKVSEKSSADGNVDLLTPPSSPVLESKTQEGSRKNSEAADLSSRLYFARVETDFEGDVFDEVNCLKDFYIDDVSRPVKKIGGVIVECPNDGTNFEVPINYPEDFTITCVKVLQDHSNEEENLCEDAPCENEMREDETENDEEEKIIETAEDYEMRNTRAQMRRCSSLKSWKTPPGTPGGKKIVRFADALGLDLADVRTFLDEIPKIPSSAYEDLHFDLPKFEKLPPCPSTLHPLFQQPGNKIDFLEKVQNQKICLESTVVTDEGVLAVTGFIRVLNLSFHKSVHVRYTLNNWETFSDLQATYVPSSSDGFSDRFSFVLYGHTLKIKEKLEFALRLECCGAQYWDNNGGLNYVLNCLPQSSASSFFLSLCNNQVDPWFDFY